LIWLVATQKNDQFLFCPGTYDTFGYPSIAHLPFRCYDKKRQEEHTDENSTANGNSIRTSSAGKRVYTGMNRVYVQSERVITAKPEEVYATLIGYQNKRPSILTPNFVGYSVEI